MKIVIKGAGDLATGIASRLYHAGHQIVMTEIAVPLTVRRSVALSRAVYENEAEVEDLKGVLVKDAAEADRILQRGEIPVLVDPEADIIGSFHPDVVVDAILAKKNLGTRITDAPFVIGVGDVYKRQSLVQQQRYPHDSLRYPRRWCSVRRRQARP